MLSNGTVGKCLVVTDGVFSMDGDVAPLASIAACCERSGAGLMVDDAHGFGVLGPGGRGSVADAGLTPAQVPILVGTLGKAFGTTGAFVLGSQALVQALVQFARTYVYTTAMPPALAMASLESLSLVRSGERQAQLHERIKQFRRGAQQLGFQLLPSDTPIQPLVVGDSDRVMHLSGRLQEQGILLAGIRPPTVPEGTARLRVALSASHRPIDVDKLLEALASLSQDGLI
jgi:8-amino-7-oxononanoate synthase